MVTILAAALMILASAGQLWAATNSLTITEKAGRTTSNYPIQIGRPFVRGEIANFPQAVIGATAVTTQADVKTRWPDGSVKHAVLSFLIPTLAANGTVTVSFRNQTTGNTAGYLDKVKMLDAVYDFDAKMALTNGTTKTASARAMLDAGNFTYWLQGSVCTSVILADHGANRTYDIGFDAYKPFRPIFLATFWPGINKVRVRFIGEAANTEEFEDLVYALSLTTGAASPTPVYSKAPFTHYAGSRWTKEFWIGGAPSAIAINHNLAYLASTKLVPNYDTSRVVPEATLASVYRTWTSAARDLYDAGNWMKAMGGAGGRPDLGPFPAWTVRWLYSGDSRIRDMALGNADLAAAWPIHLREGKTGKYFDAAHTIDAGGKVISIKARPSLFVGNALGYVTYYYPGTNTTDDRITLPGTRTNGGWTWDVAHFPEPFYPQYLLTGDFWYLEEMYFWQATAAAHENPTAYWGRGPTGAYGGCGGSQVREEAWALRGRVHVAAAAPDDAPEKAYFEALIGDAIAGFEGRYAIQGTPYQGNTMYNWAASSSGYRKNFTTLGGNPPLNNWWFGRSAFVQEGMDPAKVGSAESIFEEEYVLLALGLGKRLGYATGPLFSYIAAHFINIVTHPDFSPYLVSAYRFPVRGTSGAYFSTWAAAKGAYLSTWNPVAYFNANMRDAEHGYAFIGMAGLSMATGEPNGQAAWNWIAANVASDPYRVLNGNPKWVLVPDTVEQAPQRPRNVRIR